MPKRNKHPKHPSGISQLAQQLVELSTTPLILPRPQFAPSVSEYMSAIGRKGGQIGGKRRMETMTAAERRRIATKAAKARWGKAKKNP